ncbi:MAG: DNA repair exonuclease [Deltaproteobacteria bacterium]|nr:DNA repair exonuclease [Deltaproteobacteria bacterium]
MTESPWFSFVHCADLHLDSPFEGLHALEPDIAQVLRRATFQAFDNIIDLAVKEKAAFLIVAGDVYDSAHRSLSAQLRFRESLRRAAEAGVQCFVAHGNHDPLSGWEAELALPEGVHRFGGDRVEQFAVRQGDEILARVYGISYPTREIKDNLVPRFPRKVDGPFAIGVLHGNVGGDPNHDNYAPCSLSDLVSCPMDYWALGHIHNARILREEAPCVVYPGTPQGRNVRETGARGCFLVRVDAGGRPVPEFVPTDTVRWFVETLDISALDNLNDLLEELARLKEDIRTRAAGRGAVWRLSLTGRGRLHTLLRKLDLERDLTQPLREGEAGQTAFVWLESTFLRTRPPVDLARRRQMQDFIGDLLRAADHLRHDPDPPRVLQEVLSRRPEHRLLAVRLAQLASGDWLTLLEEAESLALDLLLEEEED